MLRPLDQKGPARRGRFVAEFAAQTALLAAIIALSRFGGTAALWALPWVGATIARAPRLAGGRFTAALFARGPGARAWASGGAAA